MSKPTDDLIDRLAGSAGPITPIRPAAQRFAMICLPLLAIIALVAFWAGDPVTVMEHMSDPAFALSSIAAVLTGLASIFSAIAVSVPGRTRTGVSWVIIFALVWLVSTAFLCTRGMAAHQGHDISIFAGGDCFVFIMMSGTVLSLFLFATLRHSVCINTIRVTALMGLAAATLGATLLAFFHPPETDLVDFGAHLAATAALMLFMITAGRNALREA